MRKLGVQVQGPDPPASAERDTDVGGAAMRLRTNLGTGPLRHGGTPPDLDLLSPSLRKQPGCFLIHLRKQPGCFLTPKPVGRIASRGALPAAGARRRKAGWESGRAPSRSH